MPETKTLIWVALAAMAPGTARPISFLISGVRRGQRTSTFAPDLRTPHQSRAAWLTPATTMPMEPQTAA